MTETQANSTVHPTQLPAKVAVPVAGNCNEPKVEVLRQDGVVQAIRVSCSCGNTVDIQCDYSEVTSTSREDG